MEGVYIIVLYRRISCLAELCKTSGRISFCETYTILLIERFSRKEIDYRGVKKWREVSWINWSGVEESYQKDQI